MSHAVSRKDMILNALRAAGEEGMTADALTEPAGLTVAQLTSHLSQLAYKGYVRRLSFKRKDRHGRMAIVWGLADASSPPEPAKSKRTTPGAQQDKILEALRARGATGFTCEEMAEHIDISVNKLPSYLVRMEQLGLVQALARKRKNKAGRSTKVWVIVGEKQVTHESRPVEFWADIRKRVTAYVKDKSEGLSDVVFDQVFRDFEIDMQDLVKVFMTRLKNKQRSQIEPEVVSRKAVFAACRTLQIDPPKVGEPVDEVKAKRNKREMVRMYHPDAAKVSNDTTREMYEAVINAYETVMQYNDSLRRSHAA